MMGHDGMEKKAEDLAKRDNCALPKRALMLQTQETQANKRRQALNRTLTGALFARCSGRCCLGGLHDSPAIDVRGTYTI